MCVGDGVDSGSPVQTPIVSGAKEGEGIGVANFAVKTVGREPVADGARRDARLVELADWRGVGRRVDVGRRARVGGDPVGLLQRGLQFFVLS